MNGERGSCERGSTLVEVTIVAALLVPLLFAALNTSSLVQRNLGTTELQAEMAQRLQRVTEIVYALARPALASTVEMQDVDSGAWETPLPATEYRALRFRTDDPLQPTVQLAFERDPGEIANGKDDDGDGLVDEGSLRLGFGAEAPGTVASRVELATFRLEGRTLTFTMRCARRDHGGRVLRSQRQVTVCLRNS